MGLLVKSLTSLPASFPSIHSFCFFHLFFSFLLFLSSFEKTGPRKTMRVSWTAKKTNEWVLNKAEVKRELLDAVKASNLAYCGHTTRKQGSCLEKEIMQGTMPGARRRGRPRTAWMDNINAWTGLSVEESIRMEMEKWRKYIAWPTRGSKTAKEQNRTEHNVRTLNFYRMTLFAIHLYVSFSLCLCVTSGISTLVK